MDNGMEKEVERKNNNKNRTGISRLSENISLSGN
jgi:hypothetical protein